MAHLGDAVPSLAPDPSPSTAARTTPEDPGPSSGEVASVSVGAKAPDPDKPADQDQHHNPPNQRSHPSAPDRPLDRTYSQLVGVAVGVISSAGLAWIAIREWRRPPGT